MEKEIEKKVNKAVDPKRSRIIDNPLLKSTLRPSRRVAGVSTKEDKVSIHDRVAAKPRAAAAVDEDKISVFEIITDLEKQLDAAFSIKDAQEDELYILKEKLEKAQEEIAAMSSRLREMKEDSVSQEALSSELEFLENERLEMGEKMRSSEEELQQKTDQTEELKQKIEMFIRDTGTRDIRIEQIELELDSANKTIQSFQKQITLLEDEKEQVAETLDKVEEQTSIAIVDRDKCKKELERARESLDEIRMMLAQTRTKAREHYYNSKHKKQSRKI